MGKLYLVSTPIGNLKDITFRAKEILLKGDIILAEDTRKTGQMLLKLGQRKGKLVSYFQENEEKRIPQIITWLKQGKEICLVSNSGTPLLSDPGYKLVKEALRQGLTVIPLPGASALLAGLVASGFPIDRFVFLGFLPKRGGRKKKLLKEAVKSKSIPVIVFYESPKRLIKTLEVIKELFSNPSLVIAKEMTKKFEEFIRGNLDQILLELKKRKKIKGEVTVILKQNE